MQKVGTTLKQRLTVSVVCGEMYREIWEFCKKCRKWDQVKKYIYIFFVVLWMGVMCIFSFFLSDKKKKGKRLKGMERKEPNTEQASPWITVKPWQEKTFFPLRGEEEGTWWGVERRLRAFIQTWLDPPPHPPGMGVWEKASNGRFGTGIVVCELGNWEKMNKAFFREQMYQDTNLIHKRWGLI